MAKFFKELRNNLQKIANLEINDVAFKIASQKDVKDLVIRLNTKGEKTSQLFKFGEDSLGNSLGEYSPYTVVEKIKKGQPTDRITLKDTGDFYNSFIVVPYRGGFTINADPIKEENNLFTDFGIDILGLNDENLGILSEVYKDKVLEEIRRRIGSGLL